jgi:hypothetical protein
MRVPPVIMVQFAVLLATYSFRKDNYQEMEELLIQAGME